METKEEAARRLKNVIAAAHRNVELLWVAEPTQLCSRLQLVCDAAAAVVANYDLFFFP